MAQPIKTSVGCQSDGPRAGGLDCNGRRNLLTVVPTKKPKAVGVMAVTPARVEIPTRVADPMRRAILHVDPERFPPRLRRRAVAPIYDHAAPGMVKRFAARAAPVRNEI
jgi:hypothetical protein